MSEGPPPKRPELADQLTWHHQGDEAKTFEQLSAKFKKAMLAAKKYEWPQERCVCFGFEIEAEITAKGLVAADQAALAATMVAEAIKADILLEKQKKWKMRRIWHVMTKQEGAGEMCAAIAAWATHVAEAALFGQMHAKYTKAMMVAQKYGWTRERCRCVGLEIDEQITEKGINAADQATFAVDTVTEAIKADILLEKQKKWKMRRIWHVMTKQEGAGEMCAAIAAWAAHVAEDAQNAEYAQMYAKYTKAILLAKKYGWTQERCRCFGMKIDAELVACASLALGMEVGEVDPEIADKAIDAAYKAKFAVDMVADELKADIKREKQKKWKMRRIMYVMTQQEGPAALFEAVASWATKAVELPSLQQLEDAINAKNIQLYEKQAEMLASPRSQRKALKLEVDQLDAELQKLSNRQRVQAEDHKAMFDWA